jgi:hypothetical protein
VTKDALNAAWTIAVEECGASEDDRELFLAQMQGFKRFEYRFVGALGFDVELWMSEGLRTAYVTCYREEETPERRTMIDRANKRLAEELPL